MRTGFSIAPTKAVLVTLIVTLFVSTVYAQRREAVLYSFNAGTDGADPYGGLIFDAAGNLYGTTGGGGSRCGTVFELMPKAGGGWTERVLHTFHGTDKTPPLTAQPDGCSPLAGLIFDTAGNLYGTTIYSTYFGYFGLCCGTVFELTPKGDGSWAETTLYTFNNDGKDGSMPVGSLTLDADGNLYGAMSNGGTYNGGTVFELTPNGSAGWTETTLHSFANDGIGGWLPSSGLIFDAAGNLYGETFYGGTSVCEHSFTCGTVFELTPKAGGGWAAEVLHSFGNGTDGLVPGGGLIFDATGNLYGTTSYNSSGVGSCGAVFEMVRKASGGWEEGVLHNFNNDGQEACRPFAGLLLDSSGNLYGTTFYGGTYDGGTVFGLRRKAGRWQEGVLYSFGKGTDGSEPFAGLASDTAGNLFGTTTTGGNYVYYGTVFAVKP